MQRPSLNFPAVRAFVRAMLPSAAAHAEAAYADAQFDGGEWSAPLHDLLWEGERERIAGAVAPRFGLLPLELLYDVAVASDYEDRCMQAGAQRAADRRRARAAELMLYSRIEWMLWAQELSRGGPLPAGEAAAMIVKYIPEVPSITAALALLAAR